MPADNRERRVVTVLFSDLAGFTRMSESLDPEEIADTVDALFNRFRPLIEREGGTIDKFIGDAVMAVFGAPVAHRDDPARAVRAGLAMQREIVAFNAARGVDLRMRVGIATGEALWGSVAGARDSAMGDAVNVAQRMESSAVPGSVRVSRSTERAARGNFEFAAEGTVAVKGREAPVEAFAVKGEAAAPALEADSPMVGRADELARLTAAIETGKGGFFVLSGEAGTGKSRLAQEFRRVAEAREGVWVAAGRALEAVKLPLVAFGDIGAGNIAGSLAAAISDPVERENIAHLIAISLGGTVPGARVANLDVARMADEMRRAWALWIGARSPAVLIVEDLHCPTKEPSRCSKPSRPP
ncbi:MAG: adenylate/guanylate cyclase domain-containing protein [Planctomycetes bacterium]|nr:adenylate/guanylate cyclase domain-containing protein [Planctomycetota bacterium]